MKLTFAKYLSFSLLLLAILIINLYNWQSNLIALIFGILFLSLHGLILGRIILPRDKSAAQFIFGVLFFLALISSLGAIIYYFYQLNTEIVSLMIAGLTALLCLITSKEKEKLLSPGLARELPLTETKTWLKENYLLCLLTATYLALAVYSFYLLFTRQSLLSIRSPWETLPAKFFISYLLASFALISVLTTSKRTWLSIVLTSIQTLLSLSVALFIYGLGYGFDSFIHQATEQVILATGSITPKPLYYLGQYSLVVFLGRLLSLNLVWLDKLLVPLLATIYLPLTIYYSFSRYLERRDSYLPLLGLGFLLLPFTAFIVTTPQNLANLFSLLIIFLALPYLQGKIKFLPLALLGLADILIHPLAGIPIAIFLTLILAFQHQTAFSLLPKKIYFWLLFLLASIALPAVFLAFSYLSPSLGARLNTDALQNPSELISALAPAEITKRYSFIYDLIYSYRASLNIILLLAGLGVIIYIFRKKQHQKLLIYPLSWLAIFINYLILKSFFVFPALIDYEQGEYPKRVLEISFYFLLPLILFVLYYFLRKLFEKKFAHPSEGVIFKTIWIAFFASFLAISLYLSYPRVDKYEMSHGYSLSASDIKAVHFIDASAQGQDYIVLANQTVSSAAIHEFGFRKYYKPATSYQQPATRNPQPATSNPQPIFYYPLPTGGPLYQFYLDMVYQKPTKETMEKAMDLVGVNVAYLVINKYWRQADQINNIATNEADSFESIDGGRVMVFRYIR